ncbi:hypothetical protein GGR52DRAFT_524766 [Hypoxylon sp. FL1284]|nr:hypothetical protein GGR52DRAFT_524766 [Hypoxylon sp. FL1284]
MYVSTHIVGRILLLLYYVYGQYCPTYCEVRRMRRHASPRMPGPVELLMWHLDDVRRGGQESKSVKRATRSARQNPTGSAA